MEGVASLVFFHSFAQPGSECWLSPTSPGPLSCFHIYLWEKKSFHLCRDVREVRTHKPTKSHLIESVGEEVKIHSKV